MSLASLLVRIGDVNDPARPRPLVTLEEFFLDNHDFASFGYNLPNPPAPQEVFALLKEIRSQSGVANVLMEVKDQEDPDGWPSSDTIWIISSLSLEEVQCLIPEELAPDQWLTGFPTDAPGVELVNVPPGARPYGAWYD